MYIGAAASLWCVRAWKIDQLAQIEEKEEAENPSLERVPSAARSQLHRPWMARYARNIFRWQKV